MEFAVRLKKDLNSEIILIKLLFVCITLHFEPYNVLSDKYWS